jgi:hypothetical protein
MSSLLDHVSSDHPLLDAPTAEAVLAREAGLPFESPMSLDGHADPIAQWLSLMEVVSMLCPDWPVREHGLQGKNWRL